MYKILTLLFAVVLLFSAGALAHDINIQPTSGPSAGAIKFGMGFSPKNPDIIYVDRFKSTDGGETWSEFDYPTFQAVNTIAVDPNNSNTVYLGANDLLFKSTDGAKSWQDLGALGSMGGTISAITVDPSNSSTVFAGTTHGEFYTSTNGGQNWTDISSKLNANSPISRIAFNTENSNEVFVSTGSWYWSSLVAQPKTGNGLFKSTDGGETFSHLENEFGSYLVQDVDAVGDTVYVTTHYAPDTVDEWYGFYKSSDGASTFEKLLDSRDHSYFDLIKITHVAVNPSDEKHIIVSAASGGERSPAFLLSYDGGNTWKSINEKDGSTEAIQYTHELELLADGTAFAMDYYRPFMKSTDGGQTWKWSAKGIRRSSIQAMEVHPSNRNNVFAGTLDGALHITYDGGKTWNRVSSGLDGTYISSIEFHPQNLDIFYFGVSGVAARDGRYFGQPNTETGLYFTANAGKSWTKTDGLVDPEIPELQNEVYDILVHPKDPNLILVATSDDGVYKSEDGGKTWSEANSGIPKEGFYWNLNFDGPGENEDEIECKQKIFKGIGRNWDCFYYATRTSMSLFVNPNDENEIWYLTLNGIFVSRDRASSWEWLSDDLQNIHVHFMAFDPKDSKTIYVGTHQGAIGSDGSPIDSSKGLLISRNGGKNWQQVKDGPGEGRDVRAIGVNPKNPNFVAVGTDAPFYVSEDKGKTWRELKFQEEVSEVDKILIDDTAKIIYLGTKSSGIWRGILDYDSDSPALVEITGVAFLPTATVNETFDVFVSVDNIGGGSGSLDIKLNIGEFESTKTVNLSKADSDSANFSLSLQEAGTYGVLVNGLEHGVVNVVPEPVAQEPEPPVMPPEQPPGSRELPPQETEPKNVQKTLEETATSQAKNPLEAILNSLASFFASLFGGQ